MTRSGDFIELSHRANAMHYSHWNLDNLDFEAALDPMAPDVWLKYRSLNFVLPFVEVDRNNTWVTLGDGKYGKEGFFLGRQGADVLLTDLDPRVLQAMKDAGLIEKFAKENAERLSFEDESFDFVFTQETLHHLPRPYLALYEMHRVANKAFIFSEPVDPWAPDAPVLYAQARLKKEMWDKMGVKDGMAFEEAGNYAYFFTRREMEKFALGLNLKWIAVKGYSEVFLHSMPSYREGEQYRMDRKSDAITEWEGELKRREIMAENGWRQHDKQLWAFFKNDALAEQMAPQLREEGWEVKELPTNPHLDHYENLSAKYQE